MAAIDSSNAPESKLELLVDNLSEAMRWGCEDDDYCLGLGVMEIFLLTKLRFMPLENRRSLVLHLQASNDMHGKAREQFLFSRRFQTFPTLDGPEHIQTELLLLAITA